MRELAREPEAAANHFREHLREDGCDLVIIRFLIAQLVSEDREVAEYAVQQLLRIGEPIRGILETIRENPTSTLQGFRLELLRIELDEVPPPTDAARYNRLITLAGWVDEHFRALRREYGELPPTAEEHP